MNMVTKGDISEIFRDPELDPEVRDEVEKELEARRLIRRLITMRAAAGLSQSQIAERMGCSQGTISKLEHSKDDDLTLGDIKAYAEAVSGAFKWAVTPNDLTPVDQVKEHALAIDGHMRSMAKLAHVDDNIAKSVVKFFGEVLFGMYRLIGDAASQLPPQQEGNPRLELTFIDDARADDELDDAGSKAYLHS